MGAKAHLQPLYCKHIEGAYESRLVAAFEFGGRAAVANAKMEAYFVRKWKLSGGLERYRSILGAIAGTNNSPLN